MTRFLKDWLKGYLEYTSLSEAPELFHFWTGVSTIASALKRRVWIDQRYFEWTPNFYVIFVAPPGVATKSTTIGIGSSMLRELDGVNFGPDSGTWQAIGKSLEDSLELVPMESNNLEGEMQEMSCITCTPGELGTFLDFSDRKLVDTLTSLWDGQRTAFEHRTATNGTIFIKNPWINIISATTPAWLKRNVPEEAIGGGFASRVIFVFAEKKRRLIAYPGQADHSYANDKLRSDLVSDLQSIGQLVGEMRLTPEAIEWGTAWYQQHWEQRAVHMASDRFDGYIARKQTHIHKLAMVMSVAEGDSLWVTDQHLKDASRITSAMEQDMLRVFESIGVSENSKYIQEIIAFLHTYDKQGQAVEQQSLYRHCFQVMSHQEYEEAMQSAIKAGYVQIIQSDNKIYVRLLVKPQDLGKPKEG